MARTAETAARGRARGLVIAAPASGSGKTVIAMALLRHLRNAGHNVASAKIGPDYIDPAFHAAASGRDCVNLDGWAMREATLARLVDGLRESADLVIAEGVMGLFDGIDAAGTGSTAELAERLGWPVVLVLDVRGQAASAAAVLAGCARHRPGTRLAGVIFNRIGGTSHRLVVSEACRASTPEIAELGFLGRDPRLHLAEEAELSDLRRAGAATRRSCRVGARPAPKSPPSRRWPTRARRNPPTPSTCRADIPSFMPASSPAMRGFARA